MTTTKAAACVAAVAVAAFCLQSSGQQFQKTPIVFTCQCKDPAAVHYATAFRDLLAESPVYEEVHAPADPTIPEPGKAVPWTISVISIDPSDRKDGAQTALSVVLSVAGIFMDHTVQICGDMSVKKCAEHTFAFADQNIVPLKAGD
jgi:hypothetical protein